MFLVSLFAPHDDLVRWAGAGGLFRWLPLQGLQFQAQANRRFHALCACVPSSRHVVIRY